MFALATGKLDAAWLIYDAITAALRLLAERFAGHLMASSPPSVARVRPIHAALIRGLGGADPAEAFLRERYGILIEPQLRTRLAPGEPGRPGRPKGAVVQDDVFCYVLAILVDTFEGEKSAIEIPC